MWTTLEAVLDQLAFQGQTQGQTNLLTSLSTGW